MSGNKTNISIKLAFFATIFTALVFLFLFLFIGLNQRRYSYQDSKLLVKEISRNKATEIENYFTTALMLSRSMVQKSLLLRKYQADRTEIVELLRTTLNRSPNILAVWTMWEHNSYDGKDDFYRNKGYYDPDGNLSVTFFRYKDTVLFEDTQTEDYFEDYYTIPKTTKQELIIEPYFYQYQGYPYVYWETSVVVPVIVDSVFIGTFGIDYSLDSLQNNLNRIKIYENGYISLISNEGIIVSHIDSTRINQNFNSIAKPEDSLSLRAIKNGLEYSYETISEFSGDEVFRFFYPIRLGNGQKPWSIMVEIPIDEATTRSKQLYNIAIGTIIVGFSLLIYLIFNIIDRRRYEKDLLLAKLKVEESDKLKTAFLNNISHEIRTPLNGILGFTELIIDTHPTDKQIHDYKEIIRSSSNQLLSTITNVLELSKIQASNVNLVITPFDYEKSLLNLVATFHYEIKDKGLTLETRFPSVNHQKIINSDEEKFQQIIANLLSNAIKFTKTGGVEVGYVLIDSSIEFYIKDTGVGIKPENAKRIFDFFTQEDQTLSRNFGGLGIGLSIAKSYVEVLGGSITFDSQVGIGTTFYVTIPISKQFDKHQPKPNIIHSVGSDNCVLIVEDEEYNLYLLKEILRDLGVIVFCATNGTDAVEICKKESSIALVLMDIRIPVMDGYEASMIIKSFRKDLPIIAVTAYSQIHESTNKTIFDSIISKPYNKEEIVRTVKSVLQNKTDSTNQTS